jgi:hypothetical protein
VRVRVGSAMPAALGRMVDRVIGVGALIDALPGTLAAGADDPMLPGAGAERPLVVVPACGPRPPTPWARALVAAADVVVLLDAVEANDLGDSLGDRPVLAAGLAAPAEAADAEGLDQGESPPSELAAAWRAGRDPGRGGPGVAWVGGRGATALAEALEAWAAGRAVVALPGTPHHDLLRRGRVLRADTILEALEATRFLRANPPLARSLGTRGRETARALPSAADVAMALAEGAELARQSREAVP